jgi:hypothetical protein
MTATADLKRSLYAAQEAWRPIMRCPTKDKAARDVILFGAKAVQTKPSTKAGAAQAARIARKAPQTMVKVSKATYGASHTFSNFTYISRNGKVAMFDQDGVEISDVAEMRALADEWRALNYDSAELGSRHASPDARRLILSMPRGTDPEIVLRAARASARQLFEDNFDYVYALHTDEGKGKNPNPHVHLTIRAQGHDGTKLAFGPGDLLYMRRVFAAELRERGVDADATPQITRGPRFNNEHSKTYQARLNVEKNNNDGTKLRRSFERDNRRSEAGADREYISADIVGLYTDLMRDLAKSRDPGFQKLAREFGQFVNFNFKTNIDLAGAAIEGPGTVPLQSNPDFRAGVCSPMRR